MTLDEIARILSQHAHEIAWEQRHEFMAETRRQDAERAEREQRRQTKTPGFGKVSLDNATVASNGGRQQRRPGSQPSRGSGFGLEAAPDAGVAPRSAARGRPD